LAVAVAAPGQAPAPVLELMGEMGKNVRALQEAVDRADHQSVAQQAQALGTRAEALALQVEARPASERTDFAWHVRVLQEGVAALLAAGRDGALPLEREGLRSLSSACTACHVQFRTDKEAALPWPSEGAIVAGRVRVATLAGTPRDQVDDVVVFVDGLPAAPAPEGKRAVIVQKDRTFDPNILVVTVGTTVDFPNLDTVFHNIFSLSKTHAFDCGLYGRGESRAQRFDQPGLVKIYCNIHPEMVAHVLVLNNPHATRTTPGGFYCLSGLPGGRMSLRAWSELGAEANVPLQLAEDTLLPSDLSLQERGKRAPHKNKYGRSYREKY